MEEENKDFVLEIPQTAEKEEESGNLQDVTELFEEPAPPTREEILAASRKENKYGDELDMQWRGKAGGLAFSFGLMLAGIVILVSVLTDGRFPVEMMFVVCGMQAMQGIVMGIKCRGRIKKLGLAQGITFAVLTACFLALWILQLCGVIK